MKKFRGIAVFLAALALTLVIVNLQLAWNLHSPDYLQGVADRAATNEAVAAALPDYAASKLPNPEATKKVFTEQLRPSAIADTLDSLYVSITHAYVGKTDVVEIDMSPITVPISASGYQIPPGTAFASDSIQVGGLAAVLRLGQRSLVPSLLVLAACLTIVVLISITRGVVPSLRNVLLVTCLLLGGLLLATLVIPILISSLVASSGLDAALRDIVLAYTNVLVTDAGRFYLAWMLALGVVIVALSIASGLVHRARRPNKRLKRHKQPIESKSDTKEL